MWKSSNFEASTIAAVIYALTLLRMMHREMRKLRQGMSAATHGVSLARRLVESGYMTNFPNWMLACNYLRARFFVVSHRGRSGTCFISVLDGAQSCLFGRNLITQSLCCLSHLLFAGLASLCTCRYFDKLRMFFSCEIFMDICWKHAR